jgi:hypothetical protein
MQRDSALDLSRSVQARMNMLPADADQLSERLVVERDKHVARHNALHRLLSATNQFLFQLRLRPNEMLAPLSVPVTLAKGETAQEAVSKLRAEIAAVNAQLVQVRSAPLPTADRVKAAEEYVIRRAAVTGPRISVVRDQLQVQWQDDVIASKQDLIGVLCWLTPASVLAALKREIEETPSPVNAMSTPDRERKIAELSASLLALERKESALLDFDTILPRPEMSALSFLQVAVVAREAQVA